MVCGAIQGRQGKVQVSAGELASEPTCSFFKAACATSTSKPHVLTLSCLILHESQDLDNSLRSKHDSRLLVLRGKPHEVLPTVVERWGASLLTFERDTEPYAVQRDGKIQEELPSGVEVETCSSHTLWDMDRV